MTEILAWQGGVSTERNVAACLGTMAMDAGMDSIEMVNKVAAVLYILEGEPT